MAAPKVGEIVDGFRYKGGDPNSEGAWEQADSAPDDAPDSPEVMKEEATLAKKASFRESPVMDQALAGVGKFAYSIPGMAKLAQLAGYGDGDAKGEIETYDEMSKGVGPEDLGELAPDIAATMAGGGLVTRGMKLGKLAMTGAKKAMAMGAGAGAASTGLHQAQNVGSGKGVDGTEAAVEMGLSTLVPGAGAKIGEKLKKIAPQILRSAVKPVLNQMDTPNPPNFEKALEQELVPYFGGLEGAEKKATEKISKLGSLRDLAAEKVSYSSNGLPSVPGSAAKGAPNPTIEFLPGPLKGAKDELAKEFTNPKTKLLKSDMKDADEAFQYWAEQGVNRPTATGPTSKMTVEDALAMRQAIDDQINWREANKTLTAGFDKASVILRTQLNKFIAKESPEAGKLTQDLAEVVPFQKALGRRNMQAGNNFKLGLLDLSALAGGSGLGMAAGNPSVAVPAMAATALAIRKLTSTPGGAAMLYDAGGSLTKKSATRNTLSQLARSTYAKGND